MSAIGSLSAKIARGLAGPRFETLRFAIGAWLSALLVGALLVQLPIWRSAVETQCFDWFTQFSAPRKSQLPITIVGIDEASFTQLGLRWPWPRNIHADLVRRLNASGAAVIVFDVLFPEPASPEEDAAFAAAIGEAGNVVLAADYAFHETASIRQWLRLDPLPALSAGAAAVGLATTELDVDGVARRFPVKPDALWLETIATLIRLQPGLVDMPSLPEEAYLRHLGPDHTFPYVSYYQVLQGEASLPPDFFANQIVLIGRDMRTSTEAIGTQSDTFETPFVEISKRYTPGVEIHATAIENALMGQAIRPASARENLLILFVCMLCLTPVLGFWKPLRSIAVAAAVMIMLVIAGYLLFVHANVWILVAAPMTAIGIAMVTMTGLSYYAEQRRANRIRSAFSLYVSPTVVASMIAHPEQLRIGGERRELSILFCDLAGFTSMSERLTPDAVAAVINLYLDEMTAIIMSEGGTVDKFIGDAIMAFWGAPLPDEQHALHAVRAAIAMQAKLATLQPKFANMDAGEVKLRIGIHSGPAIVGNMGSTLRFDYTALGDAVNLASRLEGVNKLYGTGILVTAATLAALPAPLSMRRVDRIRAKGKKIPVDIFTPCENGELATETELAWQAYAEGRIATARELWSTLQARFPEDSLAPVFLERLDQMEKHPPSPDWDGATALEKF